MGRETFSFRRVGTAGREIVEPDGVIGWTVDIVWAARIVALLNGPEKASQTAPYGDHLTET